MAEMEMDLDMDTSAARMSVLGEAHYRDLMLQMQDEFSRVVAALEKQVQCLQQHNHLLRAEVELLQEDLGAQDAIAARQQETQEMFIEDVRAKCMAVQTSHDALRLERDALQVLLQQERAQWDQQRCAADDALECHKQQLEQARAQLREEEQRNAHMSQQIELLQCRVDAAVKTSRNFEQRLQQLAQLKHDERGDLEMHVQHLQRRLDEKKQQNKYLAEALMDHESRRAVVSDAGGIMETKAHPTRRHAATSSRSNSTSKDDDKESTRQPTSESHRHRHRRVRARDEMAGAIAERATPATPPSSTHRPHAPILLSEQKRAMGIDDLHSHAPTSPTVSSPSMSPPSTPQLPLPTSRRSPAQTETAPSTSTRSRSDRLARELSDLRQRIEAAMQLDE